MSFLAFFNVNVLVAGLFLGIITLLITGSAGVLILKLFSDRSQIVGVAEAGKMDPEMAGRYNDMVSIASAQISVSTITTAILCPMAVVFWHRYKLRKGIDTRGGD